MKVMGTEHILKNQAHMDGVHVKPVRLKICQHQHRLRVQG